MGARSTARECSLMILFGLDGGAGDAGQATGQFFAFLAPHVDIEADEEARAYTRELVMGVANNRESIDETIRKASTNWRLERMPRVDRNVLRLATFELTQGVARAITLDEAVSLAKRFGGEGSGAFVNGVLTKIADVLRVA